MQIIDMHAHLGDICYPNGGRLIERQVKKKAFDFFSLSEMENFATSHGAISRYLAKTRLIKKSLMVRNLSGTRENFIRSMDEAGISYSTSLPVPPNVSFTDLKQAMEKDARIIPFTAIDYTRTYDMEAAFREDVKHGAKGMKLHPILQRAKPTSRKTFEGVEAFACHGLPVISHTGPHSYYYDPQDMQNRERPEYGCVKDFLVLVRAFPQVNFIAAHAGMNEWRILQQHCSEVKNLWIECTFKGVKLIRELLRSFGAERLLFSSDWPWGCRKTALRIMKKVCGGDSGLEKRVFYENAAELMRLDLSLPDVCTC